MTTVTKNAGNRCLIAVFLGAVSLRAAMPADWPMYRHDPARSAHTSTSLADTLHLQWIREYPRPAAAWDNQKEVYCYGGPAERVEQKVSFDITYEPVVADSTVFIGSPNNDRVTALALADGEERWRFYAGGPVRLAPALGDGRVYFGSDDGFLYCVSADNGSLVWKRQLAFTQRKVMGNDRLISVWPVRGGPVLAPNSADSSRLVVYAAAGLYSFEGTVVCALDAATGEMLWRNDGAGMFFTENPHGGAEGIAGIAPQGYLVVTSDNGLLVPNGRALPALFDRTTGELRYWRHGGMTKGLGGFHVAVHEDTFYCRDRAFLLSDGSDAGPAPPQYSEWDLQIAAGDRVFRVDGIREADFAGTYERDFVVTDGSWEAAVSGMPKSLLAAGGRLLVSTVLGRVYCFGPDSVTAAQVLLDTRAAPNLDDAARRQARDLLTDTGYRRGSRGIAILAEIDDSRLIEALLEAADDLTVIAFEPDTRTASTVRTYLDNRGLYGQRAHVIAQRFADAMAPSYVARLVTTGTWRFADDSATIAEALRVLRPYGGTAVLPGLRSRMVRRALGRPRGVGIDGSFAGVTVKREGALPGADTWTHEHHAAAQTNFSRDSLVRTPLGILWFGGSADNTNDRMLPRHGHGQSPQIAGGHIYQMGRDVLRCVDQYTGRVLWEKTLPNVGQFSDYSEHEAGNIGLGDYFTAQLDAVYVLSGRDECELSRSCLVLDPHDGSVTAELTLPDSAAWGMLAVCDSFLIATGTPIAFDSTIEDCYVYSYKKKNLVGPGGLNTLNYAASRTLYVLNRHSGELRWHTDAETSFFHRAVAAGNGRLYAIDRFPTPGADTSAPSAVKTWDLRSGQLLWTDSTRVFARYLAYSPAYDLLVQASRASRDYFKGEPRPNRMTCWKAANGSVLWEIAPDVDEAGSILGELFYYGGPIMLNDRTILTQNGNDFGAVDLLTGAVHTVDHPLTDEKIDFYFRRHYGCTYAKGCPSLIAFRSGNAGMFDLENMSGVHTFGGFKSGCTPSLIPGGGLLNAPEYTRTCGCSYPLQTSCALVYSPSTELWTTNEGLAKRTGAAVLKRVGLNFGAPGDRMDEHGMLWLDYPAGAVAVGFAGQELPVGLTVDGDSVRPYRGHSLRFSGPAPWIGCSGLEGATRITVDLTLDSLSEDSTAVPVCAPPREVDLTLYFAEPVFESAGQRVFAVTVNDSVIADAYDPCAAAGGSRTTTMLRVGPMTVRDSVSIACTPLVGRTVISGIGIAPHGEEAVADAHGPARGYVDLSRQADRR